MEAVLLFKKQKLTKKTREKKRKKNTTVANNEFHAMKTISKSDLRRHLHSLP